MILTYCDACKQKIKGLCVHLGKEQYCKYCGERYIRTKIPDIDLKIEEIIKKNEKT